MIRVKVEMVPMGREDRAYLIGAVEIANIRPRGEWSDYKFRLWTDQDVKALVDNRSWTTGPAIPNLFAVKEGEVRGHYRKNGVWQLLHGVLDEIGMCEHP